jgi:NAD(P)-dependent dehydrogenase (short-subunit alcohol dehydrogenase family)
MAALQNKTALVTGASRGIGRATATTLAEAGAHVLVHYGRSKQEAESLVAEIQGRGGHADLVSADLGTPEGAALLAKQVRSIVGDRLDVLVLNAGTSKSARLADQAHPFLKPVHLLRAGPDILILIYSSYLFPEESRENSGGNGLSGLSWSHRMLSTHQRLPSFNN